MIEEGFVTFDYGMPKDVWNVVLEETISLSDVKNQGNYKEERRQ